MTKVFCFFSNFRLMLLADTGCTVEQSTVSMEIYVSTMWLSVRKSTAERASPAGLEPRLTADECNGDQSLSIERSIKPGR